MMKDPHSSQDAFEPRAFREVFDLREWARVISAHAWWVVIITVAVVVGTAMVNVTATPYYRATQRILLERDSEKVLQVEAAYETRSGDNDYYLTQYKILESAAVARAALDLLPAADRAWFEQKGSAVDSFMHLCKVVPIRKSRLVDVHTEHPEPKVAEFMAHALVKAFVQNSENRRAAASDSATKRLREDARSLKSKMLEARRVSQDYKARHGIFAIHDRQSLAGFRLQTLNTELAIVERDLSDSDSRLSTASEAVRKGDYSSDLPELLNNKVIAEFKLRVLDFSSKLSQLEEKYKPKHPRITEMRSKVKSARDQLHREVMAVYGGLKHENVRVAKATEKDLEQRLAKQNKLLQAQENPPRPIRSPRRCGEGDSSDVRQGHGKAPRSRGYRGLRSLERPRDRRRPRLRRTGSPTHGHRAAASLCLRVSSCPSRWRSSWMRSTTASNQGTRRNDSWISQSLAWFRGFRGGHSMTFHRREKRSIPRPGSPRPSARSALSCS